MEKAEKGTPLMDVGFSGAQGIIMGRAENIPEVGEIKDFTESGM